VPKLPLNIPRREFGVYSWLALFQSQVCGFGRVSFAGWLTGHIDVHVQELRVEAAEELDKCMTLGELEESFSDKRVKFVA